MTIALILAAVIGAAAGGACVMLRGSIRRRRALARRAAARRIAFPFTGLGLSEPALAAALRIAHAEDATLLPVYLALVPLELPLDVPLAGECEAALPLLEAIEQRAARAEVRVDSRIERGRSVRHALAQLIVHERFERLVVAASSHERSGDGLIPEDVGWLLDNAPGEVIALRPAPGPERAGRADPAGQAVARARAPAVPSANGRDRVTERGASVARRVAHDVAGGRARR